MGKFAFKFCLGVALTLSLMLLFGIATYFTLKKGVGFDRLSFHGMTVEKLHLRLENKLVLHIDNLRIQHSDTPRKTSANLSRIRQAIFLADATGKLFESVTIKRIAIGDAIGSFLYRGHGTGSLTLNAPAFVLDTGIIFSDSTLSFDIGNFASINYRSTAHGTIRIDLHQQRVSADLQVRLADVLPLSLHCDGDREQLTFSANGIETIHDIRPVVELFALGPDIQPWITDSLKGSTFQLTALKGTIPYAAPAKLLQTLYGTATIEDTEYSFEQKLPAITASSTSVVFENGILKIYPTHPVYAGIDAGTSWLDIDFNPDEPVLSAYINAEAPLSSEILNLLDFYEIRLPFTQTEGLTKADLTLRINLVKLEVGAEGRFHIAAGAFNYEGQTYTVTDSELTLLDDQVTITELNLGFQNIFRVKARGSLKVASHLADLKIAVEKFDLPLEDTRFVLNGQGQPLVLNYLSTQEGETLSAAESLWNVGGLPIKAAAFTTTFHAADFSGTLPPTEVTAAPSARLLLSGDFNLKKPDFNLVADIQEWKSDSLKLDQTHFPLTLQFGKNLLAASDKESAWLARGRKIQVAPFKVAYAAKKITVNQGGLRFGSVLDSTLKGKFDLAAGKGSFLLERLKIDADNRDGIGFSAKNLQLELAAKDDTWTASIPEIGLSFKKSPTAGWLLHLDGLAKMADRTALLKKYNLTKGTLDIKGASDGPPYFFSGNVTSSYAFLVKDNVPLNDYRFSGEYNGAGWSATVDDTVHIRYSDRITITSTDVGYNVAAFRDFLSDHPREEKNGEEPRIPDLDIQVDSSMLYLNPSQNAPIDGARLHAEGGKLTGQLMHRKGKAQLEMSGMHFTLLGQDFDEEFLQKILRESKFVGGKLSFYVSGLLSDFNGVAKIEDSVYKGGAILHNVLTFVNTVPDLVSFSFPEYSLTGLPFKQMYAGFSYKDHVINVNTFALESNAIDMTGAGTIHLQEDTIAMNIDIVSKMKQNISKIPLLGYLLVGDNKQPTITLEVRGALEDPEVSTSVYKEIIKTPFDILLRTISLPSHWLNQLESLGDEKGK